MWGYNERAVVPAIAVASKGVITPASLSEAADESIGFETKLLRYGRPPEEDRGSYVRPAKAEEMEQCRRAYPGHREVEHDA
jgi:hypothetical protein